MSDRLERVRVVDPHSPYDGQTVHLVLADGQIQSVEPTSESATSWVSPGWVDVLATCGQPGHEERETYATLGAAALRGGYVQVAVSPEGNPVRDNATGIAAFLAETQHLPVEFLPLGALSSGTNGAQMAELHLQQQAGAVGFFDAYRTTESALLLKLALQYTSDRDVPIYSVPVDRSLNPHGSVHESAATTRLGLKTLPTLAECIRLERDFRLLEYTGGNLHVHGVSSAEGVALVAAAKDRGLAVTADTTIAHLLFTDEDLANFDTNLKVFPPVRSKSDQEALWAGILDGTLDAISSGHRPYDIESKQIEFDYASYGAACLEYAYSAFTARYGSQHQAQSAWVRAVTHGPRNLLNLGQVRIAEGSPAELTLFNPEGPEPLREGKAFNYLPFKDLKGSSLGIFTRGNYYAFR
jgi:dihydroorotase